MAFAAGFLVRPFGALVFGRLGDMIPADIRLIESRDLFISQAVLTGEALPVKQMLGKSSRLLWSAAVPNQPISKPWPQNSSVLIRQSCFIPKISALCR